jgi:hypothetical protein
MNRESIRGWALFSILGMLVFSSCGSPAQLPATPTTGATQSIEFTATPTPAPTVFRMPMLTALPTMTSLPMPTADPDRRKMVVTSASELINGAVSGWEALIKNPGPDGISLREALQVANLTPGPKEVTFAASMMGAVIYQSADPQQSLPPLSSGDLMINGDIDNDGKPDITLDGSRGKPANPSSLGLIIWSSNNQINGMRIQNFADDSLAIYTNSPTKAKTAVGNRFTNNQIDAKRGGRGIYLRLFGPPMDGFAIQNTTIAGNTIVSGESAILLLIGGGASHSQIVGTVIQGNTTSGAQGIGIYSADTNSTWHNNFPPPSVYSTGNLIQDTVVAGNQIDGSNNYGISVLTANFGNYQNHISNLALTGNTITDSQFGIHMTAAEEGEAQPTRDNVLENVVVEKNVIVDPTYGIFLGAGEKSGLGSKFSNLIGNQAKQIVLRKNTITGYSNVGIEVWGGRATNSEEPAQNNSVTNLEILNNELSTNQADAFAGILLMGGLTLDERDAEFTGSATQNRIETARIIGNQIRGGAASIQVIGGRGEQATNNSISGLVISDNQVDQPPMIIENDSGASGNTIESAP